MFFGKSMDGDVLKYQTAENTQLQIFILTFLWYQTSPKYMISLS